MGVGDCSVAVEVDAEEGIEERDEPEEEKVRREGNKEDRRIGSLELSSVRCMSI